MSYEEVIEFQFLIGKVQLQYDLEKLERDSMYGFNSS